MAPEQSRSHYRIVPVGSTHSGFAIQRDGKMWATHSSALYLGALIDALLRGASDADAFLIAETIFKRPDPSYAERLAHFKIAGSWKPSRQPYRLENQP